MSMRDLPDMYAKSVRAEGIHIRRIKNTHVISVMYHFVAIATAPVVWIPRVIVTLVHKVISTNCLCIIVKELRAYVHLLYSGNTLYMKSKE